MKTNPEWYQNFCAGRATWRKDKRRLRRGVDTAIKREHTLRALRCIADGKKQRCNNGLVRPPIYVALLLPFVRAELREDRARRAAEMKPLDLAEVGKGRERDDWEPW